MPPEIAGGILLPFIGTALGACGVYFLKGEMSRRLKQNLSGFAAGIMIAASFFSLIQPALEESSRMGVFAFVPAVIGFLIGMAFLLLPDAVLPVIHPGGAGGGIGKTAKVALAVTLHNLPEGMAVGIASAELLYGGAGEVGLFALALGIALQNIPEGAVVSVPLYAGGKSKHSAFLAGVLSGAVEPIGAVLTLLAAGALLPLMPYLLGFAAGAMFCVAVEELIPEMVEDNRTGSLFFALGFALMMALDVGLG